MERRIWSVKFSTACWNEILKLCGESVSQGLEADWAFWVWMIIIIFYFCFNWGSSNPQRSGSTLKFINSLFELAFFVSLINSHTQKVKHPSIFCHLSRAVSQWLGGGEVPTFSSSGNTKMSRAGQLRGAVSVFPACPWLALGPPLSRVCPDHLSPEH